MADRLTYKQHKTIVLFYLYELLARDIKPAATVQFIKDLDGRRMSLNFLKSGIQDLYHDDKYIRFINAAGDDTEWCLTSKGIHATEDHISSYPGLHEEAEKNLQKYYDEQWGPPDSEKRSESFVEWSPLPIDRDRPEFVEAVESLETTIAAVEGDNGFAANYPEERERTVFSLKMGIELIKKAIPTKTQVRGLLFEPLGYLTKLFAEHAIGELAKKAVEKLVALFGMTI